MSPVRACEGADGAAARAISSLSFEGDHRLRAVGGGEAGDGVAAMSPAASSWTSGEASVSLYCWMRRWACGSGAGSRPVAAPLRSRGVPPVEWAELRADPVTRESGPLVFHHCIDICASISSIFFSVIARSSGLDGRLLWKNEGRTPCPPSPVASRLRILRNMSNSRLRTKSLRRLRSIISLSAALLYSLSRSALRVSRSDQLVVGWRTNFTTLDRKPPLESSLDMTRAYRVGICLPELPGDQSPNIFCLSSRRCCASRDRLAVGRAIRRPTPMASPVSSQ